MTGLWLLGCLLLAASAFAGAVFVAAADADRAQYRATCRRRVGLVP